MIQKEEVTKFETGLNSFDAFLRENALSELCDLLELGEINVRQPSNLLNLHCHTFFSYNGYGYSPSYIAWWAKKEGLFAAGTVDFDVLDAVDEFLAAAANLNIRGICGIETRAFIPELADKEINSPGEPGIAYHMGMGFTSGKVPKDSDKFLLTLRRKAAERTKNIVERVNKYLSPVEIDFDKDAVPLSPSGNVTERHVCQAYYEKAANLFKDVSQREEFWAEKLNLVDAETEKIIDDPVKLQGLIRSKTMKSGGPGYVKPDPASFPLLKDMNQFVAQCGAIPTIAWLDGASAGESDPAVLIKLHKSCGAAAINIIPDRNWNFKDPEVKKKKVLELNRVIEESIKNDFPVFVGTEMNAPGQKLIDDFSSDALVPHVDEFVKGAAILFAHTLLQPAGMGYLSKWAEDSFKSVKEKNVFFEKTGKISTPSSAVKLKQIDSSSSPELILKTLS
ncbi:MAG: hypothetical protein A2020_14375 [Lentisphaerae bacterium GWF2_45_14]|nr:MAG: hypothetical protein A2020_14375 [Lentisphaerae bacterium GWF2_45_14]